MYEYLGDKSDRIQQATMNNIRKKYYCRVKLLLRIELNLKSKVHASIQLQNH